MTDTAPQAGAMESGPLTPERMAEIAGQDALTADDLLFIEQHTELWKDYLEPGYITRTYVAHWLLTLVAAARERDAAYAAANAPIPTAYACQQCGRRDGLDSSLSHDDWGQIATLAGGKNILCLWCIDAIAASNDLHLFAVLHFAGKAVTAGSWPTIYDDDTVSELVDEVAAASSRTVRAVAEHAALERQRDALLASVRMFLSRRFIGDALGERQIAITDAQWLEAQGAYEAAIAAAKAGTP